MTVTNDFVYKPSSCDVKIFDRLDKRISWRTRVPVKLKALQEILRPQPDAMTVIKRLLGWIDRVDWASQCGEGKPAFSTPEGGPIFPPPGDNGEPDLWWLTDFSRDTARLQEQRKKKEAGNLDSADEDVEVDTDSDLDRHETDNIDDSQSSVDGSRVFGEVDFSKHDSIARANHAPSLGWRPRQEADHTDVPTPSSQPFYRGYFETQVDALCGLHCLNNCIGFCFATTADLKRACDRYLLEHPYDHRDMHEAPTGWYSSEVMALALQVTGAWKGRFRWGLEPLHINPAQLESLECVGAVINLRVKSHWVAVRYFEGEYWLLDSQKEPERLSPVHYRLYVKRHRDAYPVYRVQDNDNKDALLGPETCSTAVGPDTLGAASDTLASAGMGGSASCGSMAIDTPPPTQQSTTQLSPRAGGDEMAPEVMEAAASCTRGTKRKRRGDWDVAMPDRTGQGDYLAPALAVAQQISADDAQEMICAARHTRLT